MSFGGTGSREGTTAEPAGPAGPAGLAAGRPGSGSVRLIACILISCILGLVTAVLLYAGITGIVALAAHQASRPDGVAVIIIFVLATLAGWGCLAAWEHRRRPAAATSRPRRPILRILASCLLWALAALLAAVGVAGVVSLITGSGGSGSDRGLGYVFVAAAWCGSGAWALMKSSRSRQGRRRHRPRPARRRRVWPRQPG